MKTVLLLFLITITSSLMANEADSMRSETIKKALADLQNIKSGELEFTLRARRFYQADTSKLKIHQFFTKPKEMEAGMEYKFLINYFQSYFAYNGTAYLKDINGAKKITNPDWSEIYVIINKHNYIIPSFEQFVGRIRDQLYNSNSSITESDTLFNNQEIRLVRINIPYPYPGDSSILSYKATLYFSKEDYVPIKFHSTQRHNKMGEYYVEMTLDKYQLSELHNPKIDSLIEDQIRLAASDGETDTMVTESKIKELLPVGSSLEKFKMKELGKSEKEVIIEENLTLIYFWYIGCYPCLKAQPDLKRLYSRYYDEGLDIVALNVYDTAEKKIEKFITDYQPPYILASGNKSILPLFNISAFPTYYLIRKGKIVFGGIGYGEKFYENLNIAISENLK